MQHIRTKWHKLMSLVEQDEVYVTAPTSVVNGERMTTGKAEHWSEFNPNKQAMSWLLKQFTELPKFVVDSELLELVMREGYDHSLVDMKKAGVMRLPFGAMIVEFDYHQAHYLVMIRDQANRDTSYPWDPPMDAKDEFDRKFSLLPFFGVVFGLYDDEDGQYIVMSPSVSGLDIEAREDGPWVGITAKQFEIFPASKRMDELVARTWFKDGAAMFRAAAAAMLVMHTAGVKREVIDCTKMNRKRTASNKPPIPRHVVLSIGKVYRSDTGDKADDYVPRRSPLPHWRRGHIRMVRYGPGRASVREKYIEPKLVAFKDYAGAVQPAPPSKEYVVKK